MAGPRRLAVSGWRAAVWAVVIVVASTLVTPPAAAQNSSAQFTPESPEVLESAREVVLTVEMWRAGRVYYGTFNGGHPYEKAARAPEDYTATSGELVFAAGGKKTITIPIVDDDVAEGREAFTVAAWEEAKSDPWLDPEDRVFVHINDDEVETSGENTAAPATRSSTNTAPAGGQSSGSGVATPAPKAPGAAVTVDPAATPAAAAAPPDLSLSMGAPKPVPDRGGGGGGGWNSGLVIGSLIAALGVGALAFMRRRRRSRQSGIPLPASNGSVRFS